MALMSSFDFSDVNFSTADIFYCRGGKIGQLIVHEKWNHLLLLLLKCRHGVNPDVVVRLTPGPSHSNQPVSVSHKVLRGPEVDCSSPQEMDVVGDDGLGLFAQGR